MNKEQILHACREIIVQGGLQHLIMDDVANRCGVSKKTIYELFGSKENLLQQLGTTFLEQERAAVQAQLYKHSQLEDKIRYLIGHLIDLGELIPHEELSYLKKKFVRNYSMLQVFLESLLDQLQALLLKGQQEGAVLPALQPELHMHLLRAQLLYLHTQTRQLRRRHSLLQWRQYIIDTFLRTCLVQT